MRTRRHPPDYQRRPKPHSPQEWAIVEWALELMRWYERGRITLDEKDRLTNQGPEEAAAPIPEPAQA